MQDSKNNNNQNSNKAAEWYSNSGFNLLIDYYPEVYVRPYGSGCTEKNLTTWLGKLKPGYVQIYGVGHSGTSTYESKLDTAHPQLACDIPALFRRITSNLGIKLFVYYSGLCNGKAIEKHPEWRAWLNPKEGFENFTNASYHSNFFNTRPVCPTSGYFDEWMKIQLQEIIERADPDGFWMDGDWAGAVCYCERCRKNFSEDNGMEIKEDDLPELMDRTSELGLFWRTWMRKVNNAYRRKVADWIHSLKPNCLYSSGNVVLPTDEPNYLDYNSGDTYSPGNHRLVQSARLRYLTTLTEPYELMTCDTQYCSTVPKLRSRAKTLDRMLQEGMGVAANGGQWCYWTYPMPDGALIPSRFKTALEAKCFYEKRKQLFMGTESASETAVLIADGDAACTWPRGLIGKTAMTYIQLHRSPDVISPDNLAKSKNYKLIIVSNSIGITEDHVNEIEKRVKNGAVLIASGKALKVPGMERLLGIEMVKESSLNEAHILLADGTPAGLADNWNEVRPINAEILKPLYVSWDYKNEFFQTPEILEHLYGYPINAMMDEENPEDAGFPSVTVNKLGTGKAVYICADPYDQLITYGFPNLLKWLKELVDQVSPQPLVKIDASSWVELVLRKRNDTLLIHLINGSGGRDLAFVQTRDWFTSEIPQVGPYKIEMRFPAEPSEVSWEPQPDAGEFCWNWMNGVLTVTIECLKIHGCLKICP